MNNVDFNLIRRDLIGRVRGRILSSGDEGFSSSLSIDNGRITLRPYLVALPANTDDVAKIVSYCHDRGVPLTAKAGGHSAAGYCLNSDGVVLDLADMNAITFSDDEQRVSVGAGTRWIQVYDFLQERQSPLTVVGGGCAGVGVAGFTLGAGYSFLSRSLGMGCDNAPAMEFVSACGNVFELNESLFRKDANGNPDPKECPDKRELFRALRGGGGGNFGFVTRIDLQLQETRVPRPTMGQITFPFYRINEVLEFYNTWVETLPDEMAVYGMMRNFADPRAAGKPMLSLRFTPIYNGPFSEAIDLLKPLLDLSPNQIEFYTMTLPEWEDFVGTSTQVRGHSAYIRSLMLAPGALGHKAAEICKKWMSRSPSPDSFIVWTHTGGRIEKNGSETSCFAHRDARFLFEVKSEWNSAQPLQARPNIEWAVKFFDELEPLAQGAYLNYIDPLLLDWQKQYFRDEYGRLLEVNERWNKDGWIGFQQGIGSDYQTPARTWPLDLSPLSRTLHKAPSEAPIC